jgi:hypothetical protein
MTEALEHDIGGVPERLVLGQPQNKLLSNNNILAITFWSNYRE